MAILINGTDLSSYHGQLLEYTVAGIPYKDNYVTPLSGFFPISFNGTYGERDVYLKIDFTGSSTATAEGYASALVSAVMGGCDLLLPDGYYYKCALKKVDQTTHPAPWVSQLGIRFVGTRHGELTTHNLSSSGAITVLGNRATPCCLTVTGITGDVEVMGINITGITGSIIIDGINCTVTAGGENAFLNTDLTKWPTLAVGSNTITFTAGVAVKVEYYPLYL